MKRPALLLCLASTFLVAQAPAPPPAPGAQTAQPTAPPNPALEPIRQGNRLRSEGKYDEAMKLYAGALEKNPELYEAHAAMGVALDLKGDYAAARQHLQRAIDVASPEQKPGALRSMAMSYAFESKGKEAAKYEQQVIDADLAKQDYAGAADVTNEMARVLLESGDVAGAEKAYRTGWETIQKKPDLKPDERALWKFRWEH